MTSIHRKLKKKPLTNTKEYRFVFINFQVADDVDMNNTEKKSKSAAKKTPKKKSDDSKEETKVETTVPVGDPPKAKVANIVCF